MPRRRIAPFALLALGLALPIATLVYGWAYASARENRLKDIIIAEMVARGDPDAAHQRSWATLHRRLEMAGLGGLCAVWLFALTSAWKMNERQRELSQKQTAFIAAVTHELRTPLTTLRMHAEMLDQGLVPEARRARVHHELVRETDRLSRLVDNVLAMSKLEEGRWGLDPKRGDLVFAVQAIVDSLEPRARALGFELKVIASTRPNVSFDARALELMTQNLVDNALKYGAGIPCEVDITIEPSDKGVRLIVSDHGPGIERARRARIFDRFERGGESHKPGSGLGLALVRELARAHGGDARVLECEQGTKVAIELPDTQPT